MINLVKSSFYNEDTTRKNLAKFVLNAKQFSMGEECHKFEKTFAKKQRRKHAVFLSSGSMANLVLIQSLMNMHILKRGDKVGVSALTWSTNIMPIIQLGLIPVIIDCSINNLNINSKQLRTCIKKIDALFLTNVLGFCGDLNEIKKMCKKEDVVFIEDNCESLGSKCDRRLLGNFGLASTFSFFIGHHISTIEGGMICTDDDDLYEMLIITRAHGWDRNLSKKSQALKRQQHKVDNFYGKYTFYDLAFNGRPTEINGYLGNIQLKYWNLIVARREKNFILFNKIVVKNQDLVAIDVKHMDTVSNFAFPVICRNKEIFEKYKKNFIKHNIEIRPIIAGDMSQQPFFVKMVQRYFWKKESYPNAEYIHKNGFYFGNNPELNKIEIELICNLLRYVKDDR